ncbi:MAG: NAD(P)H-dependent glycerol-3-phosphate dehydrogenase [bacterium]
MKVTVLSAGTWGISLAALLHGKGEAVRVWEFDPEVVRVLRETRRHPRLKDFEVPEAIVPTNDLEAAMAGGDVIVCAVPAAHLRETARRTVQAGYHGQLFVICSKGIEQGTHLLPHEVAAQELGDAGRGRIVVLSGPSHAEEVSRNLPAAVTVAGETLQTAETVQSLFMTPRFRVYTQTDMVGVELGAALKNVIAIACGISDGLGFGDNAKAGLITRGLSEILRLGTAMGARSETFIGLAGVGDLVVTCMSRHSRNWKFGSLVGQGRSPEAALEEVGMVVEGYYTVGAAVELAHSWKVEMPITKAVAAVLFEGMTAMEAVSGLMLREAKSENPDAGKNP